MPGGDWGVCGENDFVPNGLNIFVGGRSQRTCAEALFD
jgi:hypothetical protein